MYLSLIGMAGSGKSYWSMKLAEHGFLRFCCDDLIAEKLAGELAEANGTSRGLAEWMGFPYELNYKVRESRYLACEVDVLNGILRDVASLEEGPEERIVIDTTGSVIYTGKEVLTNLCRFTTVVHLATPPEVKDAMLQVYLAQPRPVLWGDVFSKRSDETNEQALARCYPKLLLARERLYKRYADLSVDYHKRNEEGFGTHDFLREIQAIASKQQLAWGMEEND